MPKLSPSSSDSLVPFNSGEWRSIPWGPELVLPVSAAMHAEEDAGEEDRSSSRVCGRRLSKWTDRGTLVWMALQVTRRPPLLAELG